MRSFATQNFIAPRQNVAASLALQKNRPDPGELVYGAVNSSGRPLDSSTLATMEHKFGRSFASVRLHDDEIAHDSANMIGAEAYTLGNDIVFNRSMKDFNTQDEANLLTHELVHVVQSDTRSLPVSKSTPIRISKPTDEAEREADRLSGSLTGNSIIQPSQRLSQPTVMPRLQTITQDFHDPNFCYRAGSVRDSTHPDRTKVVAVMQAQIDTPNNCRGEMTLRTSVLRSGWGAAVANFESLGGGTSQGLSQGIIRNDAAERVDYEERFSLDNCHAQFTRCHLITYEEGGTKYIFGKARYQPNVFATSGGSGTVFNDSTPSPTLEVHPCAGVSPAC